MSAGARQRRAKPKKARRWSTPEWTRCETTDKRGYTREGAADVVMRAKTPLRPYLCSDCGRWHLTSKRA